MLNEKSDELLKIARFIGLTERGNRMKLVGGDLAGPEILYYDFVTILGSERGLWDEAGYLKDMEERAFDPVFSKMCVDLAWDLWNQEVPLLVKLIIHFKHGIRRVDDQSLIQIYRIIKAPWSQQNDGNLIFDLRLETLRIALPLILIDRGYEPMIVREKLIEVQ